MKRTGIAWVLAGSLLLPMAALAQNHHARGTEQQNAAVMSGMTGMPQGMMGMMMGRKGMMMGQPGMISMSLGPSPSMILGQKKVLDLSDEQVRKLQDLQAGASNAREADAAELRSLSKRLREVVDQSEGQPDLNRYESLLREKADREIGARLRNARLRQSVLAVLTEAQRAKLRTGMQVMHAMMKSMQRGMTQRGMTQSGGMHGTGVRSGMSGAGPCPAKDGASSDAL